MSKKIKWYDLPPEFLFLKGIKKISNTFNEKPWPIQNLEGLYRTQNRILLNFYSKVFNETLLCLDSMSESAESFDGNAPANAPIWMLWLQGFSEFPHELSFCIDSIKKHSSGHPVNFLDLSEARKLVYIPDSIMSLYDAGNLRPALLCDYIRAALLEEYGGIWLDSSVMLVRDIPDWILKVPFWSVKGLDFFPIRWSYQMVEIGKFMLWQVNLMLYFIKVFANSFSNIVRKLILQLIILCHIKYLIC